MFAIIAGPLKTEKKGDMHMYVDKGKILRS